MISLAPAFSVIIPAHNEENVLGRCLDALLADADPAELEVIVAANGCTDRTIEIARSYGDPVRVVEIVEASKHAALNAGDAAATALPRAYLDADITIGAAAIRAVAAELERTGALVGAPRAVMDFQGCPAIVRSFYRIWCELPWFSDNLVGSGIYVLSAAGHARLGAFPDITNDDQYVHDLFETRERVTASSHQFLVRPPRTVAGLIKRRTRTLIGQRELDKRFGQLPGRARRMSPFELLRQRRASLWDLMVFAAVTKAATFAAAHKELRGDRGWERDETSRAHCSCAQAAGSRGAANAGHFFQDGQRGQIDAGSDDLVAFVAHPPLLQLLACSGEAKDDHGDRPGLRAQCVDRERRAN